MKSPLAIEQEDDGEDEPYELDYDLCDEEQKSDKEQEMPLKEEKINNVAKVENKELEPVNELA